MKVNAQKLMVEIVENKRLLNGGFQRQQYSILLAVQGMCPFWG